MRCTFLAAALLVGIAGSDTVQVWDHSPKVPRGVAQQMTRWMLKKHGTLDPESWTVYQVIARKRGTLTLTDGKGHTHLAGIPCPWWRQFEREGALAFYGLGPDDVIRGTFVFQDSGSVELRR